MVSFYVVLIFQSEFEDVIECNNGYEGEGFKFDEDDVGGVFGESFFPNFPPLMERNRRKRIWQRKL